MRYKLVGLLPAAGKTAQLAFKPLLCLGSRTMIERTVDMLRAAGTERIVVVTGYRSNVLEKHIAANDVEFVRNECYESTHMFDSVLLGLDALGGEFERVLVTPADIPFIRNSTLFALTNSQYDAAVPVYNGMRGHPVVLSRNVLPAIRSYSGVDGLRGALRAVNTSEISVDDEGVVIDSNTPEDYYRLLEHFDAFDENGSRVLKPALSIALTCGETVFNDKCARFLELIELTGSMRTACACVNISYTTGWRMINQAEKQLGFRLLTRTPGGADGGSSVLTADGANFLSSYQRFSSDLEQFAAERFPISFLGAAARR